MFQPCKTQSTKSDFCVRTQGHRMIRRCSTEVPPKDCGAMWEWCALRLNGTVCALKNGCVCSDYCLFYTYCFDQYHFLISIVCFWPSLFILHSAASNGQETVAIDEANWHYVWSECVWSRLTFQELLLRVKTSRVPWHRLKLWGTPFLCYNKYSIEVYVTLCLQMISSRHVKRREQ